MRLEDRLGLLDPIAVLVFKSYGTREFVRLRGRVLERKGVQGVREETPTWRNVLNTLRRLDSDHIPGARVRAHLQGKQWDTTTDKEGYFAFELHPQEPLPPGWHDVTIELVDPLVGTPDAKFVREWVLVPSPDSEFAVISDLDDTVIRSRATDMVQQAAIVFAKGARTRTPFPGVPALFRALARGPDDRGENPIFYVSRSGWNLYDLMEDFLDLHGIPPGPLSLSDLRVIEDKSPAIGHDRHKHDSIETLLRTYPDLRFVLIGDSGQSDPELYQEIARENPGRIEAVYLHDVTEPERDREVRRIASELEADGIPTVYAEDTIPLAEHAAANNLISGSGLEEVREEVSRSRGS